jgi:hypothetical protein
MNVEKDNNSLRTYVKHAVHALDSSIKSANRFDR